MKKLVVVLLLVVSFCVGCDKIKEVLGGNERTPEYLLDKYVDGFMTSDPDKLRDVVPDFFYNYMPEKFTKEYLQSGFEREKNHFGDDMKAVYEITEKKHIEGDELSKLNDQIKDYFKTNKTASDCYYLDGSMTLIGSKDTDPDPLDAYYCKYDGTWYLIIG
jgi:hypothetical protein